jgi:8-hydroxy-5-deazaflavin:NADPH oxidoreductase
MSAGVNAVGELFRSKDQFETPRYRLQTWCPDYDPCIFLLIRHQFYVWPRKVNSVKIVVIGRGHVGGGLARLWSSRGHQVTSLGRDGGDATDAEVVVVAVAAVQIPNALGAVGGLDGQPTIDACNIYTERQDGFASLSHQIQSIIGGPTAKAFSANFASAYEQIGEQRVAPSNLYAADDGARPYAEQLSADAGYEPVYVGPLDPGARLLEDSSGLTRALAAQLGPFFYRYARPGQL